MTHIKNQNLFVVASILPGCYFKLAGYICVNIEKMKFNFINLLLTLFFAFSGNLKVFRDDAVFWVTFSCITVFIPVVFLGCLRIVSVSQNVRFIHTWPQTFSGWPSASFCMFCSLDRAA